MPRKKAHHSRKATLKDIARAAGVSATTVSLVMKDAETPRVGADTRKRIIEIADACNYRPNRTARALVSQESHTIGLVITTLANPFYAEISQDIILHAKKIGYSVVISSVRGGIEDERRSVNDLLDQGVDGLIICSALREDPVVSELIHQAVPFVLALRNIETGPGDAPVDCIAVDNERGGYLAAEHLIKIGHRRIGLLTGGQETSTGHERLVGAMAAFNAYGVEMRNDLVLKGDFKRETGYRLTLEIIEKPDRPTAVFAHNDHMAIGALEALREKGLKVPADMAVVGFDDIEMAGVPGVGLTTVSQKKATMGIMAVDALIENISGESEHIAKRLMLSPILIIRDTCGFALAGGKYRETTGPNV